MYPIPNDVELRVLVTPTDELMDLPFIQETAMQRSGVAYMIAKRVGASDEIAGAGAFLLGEHTGFITGADLLIDGGTIAGLLHRRHQRRGLARGLQGARLLAFGQGGREAAHGRGGKRELSRPGAPAPAGGVETGGAFVGTTVLYGKRSTVAGYYEVAADHGFTYAPVDILDETGGMTLPVAGGTRLNEVELGAMIFRTESHDGVHLLGYAESLGLGSQAYELIPA